MSDRRYKAHGRYSGDPRWIEARFNGRCAACGESIAAGERAFYWPKGKRLVCAGTDCGELEARRFELDCMAEAEGW